MEGFALAIRESYYKSEEEVKEDAGSAPNKEIGGAQSFRDLLSM